MRSQIFVRLHKNSAGILSYVKGFLCDMTEKFASRWRAKPSGGLCAVLPKVLKQEDIMSENIEREIKILSQKNKL